MRRGVAYGAEEGFDYRYGGANPARGRWSDDDVGPFFGGGGQDATLGASPPWAERHHSSGPLSPPYNRTTNGYHHAYPQEEAADWGGTLADDRYQHFARREAPRNNVAAMPRATRDEAAYAAEGRRSAATDQRRDEDDRTLRFDTSAASGPKSKSPMFSDHQRLAPVTPASKSCTRITVIVLAVLCVAWPALLISGIVLALSSNPQQQQIDAYNAASASFDSSTKNVLLSSAAVTIGETFARVLTPGYQSLTGTPFPNDKSVVLSTTTKAIVSENQGANTGSLSIMITYKQSADSLVGQTYQFTSPPVTLSRSATQDVYCTAAYASICGSSTCCTADQMTQQCTALVRAFSQSSTVTYVPGGVDCRLGVLCGYCQYQQYVTELCFVVQWNALNGWSRDQSKSSCTYPFLPSGQTYGNSNGGSTLILRSSDDPYLILQSLTQGTMLLTGDGGSVRGSGRALIVFACLTLLISGCLIGLTKFCGADVVSVDALERAFGCQLRRKDHSQVDGAAARRPTQPQPFDHRGAHPPIAARSHQQQRPTSPPPLPRAESPRSSDRYVVWDAPAYRDARSPPRNPTHLDDPLL